MHGSAGELGEFITAVCASLSDLPMHRLAVEKDLLRAEANGRSPSPPATRARSRSRRRPDRRKPRQ